MRHRNVFGDRKMLLGIVLVAAVGLVTSLAPTPSAVAAAAPVCPYDHNGDGQVNVAILGDSFTSGEGGGDPYDAGTDVTGQLAVVMLVENLCHRNPASWAYQVAQDKLHADHIDFIACSGATSQHVLDKGAYEAGQIAQLAEANQRAPIDVVLLSIGGNDLHFKEKVTTCVVLDCRSWFSNAADALNTKTEQEVGLGTREVLRQVRATVGPDARIHLSGYPDITGGAPFPSRCTGAQVLVTAELEAGSAFLKALNDRLHTIADEEGVSFTDPETYFAGRGACNQTDPYVNPVVIRLDGDFAVIQLGPIAVVAGVGQESFHPTAAGYAAWAERMWAQDGDVLAEPGTASG